MESNEQLDRQKLSLDFHQEIAEGLLYVHSRLNANTAKNLEAASFLYALVELLGERGIITVEELEDRKRVVGQRLAKQPEIDCGSRIPLCRATCCRLPFTLSKQDVRERTVLRDLGQTQVIP